MKYYLIAAVAFTAFMLHACRKKKQDVFFKAEAVLMPVGMSSVTGLASFVEKNGEVSVHIEISNATPGLHGIHLHADGDCHTGDQATVGGGHWNPTNSLHGIFYGQQFHLGDIGNIIIGSDGKGMLDFSTKLWSLSDKDPKRLIVDKAILFHANPDDFVTQPTGAAGSRLACGRVMLKN